MDVGKRLRQLRELKGISQYRLWKSTDISQAHLSQIEAGKTDVKAGVLSKICEVLRITVSQFFDENFPVEMPRPSAEDIGRRIRISRLASSLSQVELAKAIGVNRNVISMWESGRTWPSEAELERIAAALNVAPAVLAPHGAPPIQAARDALKDMNIMLRADQNLSEQDIKEILSFVEFTRMKRAKEAEQKPR